jgi:hypothetical protein
MMKALKRIELVLKSTYFRGKNHTQDVELERQASKSALDEIMLRYS